MLVTSDSIPCHARFSGAVRPCSGSKGKGNDTNEFGRLGRFVVQERDTSHIVSYRIVSYRHLWFGSLKPLFVDSERGQASGRHTGIHAHMYTCMAQRVSYETGSHRFEGFNDARAILRQTLIHQSRHSSTSSGTFVSFDRLISQLKRNGIYSA